MAYNKDENTIENKVLNGVLTMLRTNQIWSGTMTDLNGMLTKVLPKTDINSLPKAPSSLRMVLNRIVNRLRNRGVSVKFVRSSNKNRTRLVKFVY